MDKPLLKRFVLSAAASVLGWRSITQEAIGIVLVWGAYLIGNALAQEPSLAQMASLFSLLFWPSVVISALSFAMASFKSALPVLIALLVAMVLAVVGVRQASLISLLIANASLVMYAVGFAIHGGNIRSFSI